MISFNSARQPSSSGPTPTSIFWAGTPSPWLGSSPDPVLMPYMIPIGMLSIILGLTVLTFVIQILVSIGRKAK